MSLTVCRICAGDAGDGDCQFLYLYQRDTESRNVPGAGTCVRVGLSYAVANALFGGSAEYVALSLKSWGSETTFFWYVTVMGALAFIVSLMLHRKGKGIRL
jgi:hypothetical protein